MRMKHWQPEPSAIQPFLLLLCEAIAFPVAADGRFLGCGLELIQSPVNSGTIQVSLSYQKHHRHAEQE